MKIDWKELSKSEGYRSLKKSYVANVSGYGGRGVSECEKESALHKFHWVINRAKHYSNVLGFSVGDILTAWESKRTYCYHNYYQSLYMPRLKQETVRRQHEGKIRSLLTGQAGKS